jgi:hypothetical protein
VAAWVATKILEPDDVPGRVAALRYFGEVAVRCYELNNFNTVTSIMAALESTPVHRLRRTWEAFARKHRPLMAHVGPCAYCRQGQGWLCTRQGRCISAGSAALADEGACFSFLFVCVGSLNHIEMLMELLSARGNFSNYRKHLHAVTPPVRVLRHPPPAPGVALTRKRP